MQARDMVNTRQMRPLLVKHDVLLYSKLFLINRSTLYSTVNTKPNNIVLYCHNKVLCSGQSSGYYAFIPFMVPWMNLYTSFITNKRVRRCATRLLPIITHGTVTVYVFRGG